MISGTTGRTLRTEEAFKRPIIFKNPTKSWCRRDQNLILNLPDLDVLPGPGPEVRGQTPLFLLDTTLVNRLTTNHQPSVVDSEHLNGPGSSETLEGSPTATRSWAMAQRSQSLFMTKKTLKEPHVAQTGTRSKARRHRTSP